MAHVIISADFNQQELRLLASESEDATLMDAYLGETQKDLHTITACAIAPGEILRSGGRFILRDVELDPATGRVRYDFYEQVRKRKDGLGDFLDNVRKSAKSANFLIVFGGGAGTLATNLMIKRQVAQEYVEGWLDTYPGVPKWWAKVDEFARRNGYVQTVYGTRRHCWPNIVSQDSNQRSAMERQCRNFLIQGSASEILKIVLAGTAKTQLFKETGAKLIAPVYDEITASVPAEAAVEYCIRLSALMAITPPGHKVPMVPEISIGRDNWGNKVELGAFPSAEAVEAAVRGEPLENAA